MAYSSVCVQDWLFPTVERYVSCVINRKSGNFGKPLHLPFDISHFDKLKTMRLKGKILKDEKRKGKERKAMSHMIYNRKEYI